MTYSDRVTDIRNRYRVALTVVHAAEYRDVFNLPAPGEWGGDMTLAEWLDGFSTIDYPMPAGPHSELAEKIYQEIIAEHGVSHPPVWPNYIDNPRH